MTFIYTNSRLTFFLPSSGINFIDIYYRDGLYPVPDNTVLGAEAGGTVVQCLDGDKDRWQNRRVVFFSMGGFAEYSCVPINKLIPVPDDIPMATALALTIMGLTAHYLCLSTGQLTKDSHGEVILFPSFQAR